MWDIMGNICKSPGWVIITGNILVICGKYLGNICVGLKEFMGLYGYFSEWANEIRV